MDSHGFFFSLFILLQFFASSAFARKSYRGYKVFSTIPTTNFQLALLRRYKADLDATESKIDFWRPPSEISHPVEFLVPPLEVTEAVGFLQSYGFQWETAVEDLEREIEKERSPNAFKLSGLRRSRVHYDESPGFDFDSYHGFSAFESYLELLKDRFPDRVSLSIIGRSHEDRPIIVAKISDGNVSVAKPAVWVDGGIHAREWISPATVIYFIKTLVESEDAEVERLREKLDWYFLPMVNPDGYEWSRREDRMWRKNRSPPVRCHRWRGCCKGVDLNRNFDWHFLESGSSRSSCHETYAGKEPFSEPETKAVRDFVLSIKDKLKAFISLHAFSQIWMYPFGHKKREYPSNLEDLENVAKKATDALKKSRGTRYSMGTGADMLYSASGGSDDWAKGKVGVEFVYLLELPPCGNCKGGFILPPDQILPTASETWDALAVVGDEMISRSQTDSGSLTTSTSKPVTSTEPETSSTASSTSSQSSTESQTVTSTTPSPSTTSTTKPRPITQAKKVECTNRSRSCGWWFNRDCSRSRVKYRCQKYCEIC